MGKLKDLAKSNSNFLKIEKGERIVVEYVDYRIVPNNLDPSKDAVLYHFRELGKDKYWTNGASNIMVFFDELPSGTLVEIHRDKFLTKQKDGDGNFIEDPGKSAYKVTKVAV